MEQTTNGGPKAEGFKEVYERKSAEAKAAGIGPAPVPVVQKQVSAPKRVYKVPKLGYDEDPGEAIQQFKSEVDADFAGHPYTNKSHPLHKQYVEHFALLHDKHAEQKATEYTPGPLEVFEKQRAQKEAKAQARRVQLAEIEMKKLGTLGFNTVEIPPDISEIQYQLLRAETQYANEKYLEGDAITMEVARKLKVSSSKIQAYYQLRDVSEGADAKKTVANQITFFLNAEHKKQRKALEKTKAEIKTKVENPKERFRYL